MNDDAGAADARLALRLLARAPRRLAGICLRGGGPLRDRLLDQFRASLAADTPWRRLAPHIDDERLLGGIDVAASLTAGRTVQQAGLLAEVAGGVLIVPLAERMSEAIAGRIAQALDADEGGFILVLLDDGLDGEPRPPPALRERIAFDIDLSAATRLGDAAPCADGGEGLADMAAAEDDSLTALAGTADALGVDSVRALLFALSAAQVHAAAHHRRTLATDDLAAAGRLVLAPRATRLPPPEADPGEAPPPPEAEHPGDEQSEESAVQGPLDDRVLAAAVAAIPPGLLDLLAAGSARCRSQGSGGGQRSKSKLRGKPLGARPGMPSGGARLALIDTLRAAVPWQALRRSEGGEASFSGMLLRKSDLRIRRFEERAAAVTLVCVDASGSAALARLAEAKGAVERLLAQAYVKRTEVALIAFRGSEAAVLLPPTRSLTRARRALAELPGGGGTPLASGLALARDLAESAASRGRTPFLVFLTDGSANIAADGTPGRARAAEEALAAARALGASGLATLVIDISPRPRPEAEAIAKAMLGRYLPLPLADSATLERAVSAVQRQVVTA